MRVEAGQQDGGVMKQCRGPNRDEVNMLPVCVTFKAPENLASSNIFI